MSFNRKYKRSKYSNSIQMTTDKTKKEAEHDRIDNVAKKEEKPTSEVIFHILGHF